jgi:hypothetical protein
MFMIVGVTDGVNRGKWSTRKGRVGSGRGNS